MLKIFEKLFNTLFVDKYNCLICGAEIKPNDFCMCDKCKNAMPYNVVYCNKCGCYNNNESEYCLYCQNNIRHFTMARSPFVYKDGAKKLVINLKFYNQKFLAKYMAKSMANCYFSNNFNCNLIVPVPLSIQRKKVRGYNQAEELAKHISKILNLHLETTNLVKIKNNTPQSSLSAFERKENVAGAYKVLDKKPFEGKTILLVDDVFTTGTTCDEICQTLLKAGAKEVFILTFVSAKYELPLEKITS
ncbi:MAG: ComF family protein [Clostridia bacterium]